MPEVEPLKSVPSIFTADPNVIILWEKIGVIADVALKHMPRGLAYSVMLSRLVLEIREAYGPITARRLLAGFIEGEQGLLK